MKVKHCFSICSALLLATSLEIGLSQKVQADTQPAAQVQKDADAKTTSDQTISDEDSAETYNNAYISNPKSLDKTTEHVAISVKDMDGSVKTSSDLKNKSVGSQEFHSEKDPQKPEKQDYQNVVKTVHINANRVEDKTFNIEGTITSTADANTERFDLSQANGTVQLDSDHLDENCFNTTDKDGNKVTNPTITVNAWSDSTESRISQPIEKINKNSGINKYPNISFEFDNLDGNTLHFRIPFKFTGKISSKKESISHQEPTVREPNVPEVAPTDVAVMEESERAATGDNYSEINHEININYYDGPSEPVKTTPAVKTESSVTQTTQTTDTQENTETSSTDSIPTTDNSTVEEQNSTPVTTTTPAITTAIKQESKNTTEKPISKPVQNKPAKKTTAERATKSTTAKHTATKRVAKVKKAIVNRIAHFFKSFKTSTKTLTTHQIQTLKLILTKNAKKLSPAQRKMLKKILKKHGKKLTLRERRLIQKLITQYNKR